MPLTFVPASDDSLPLFAVDKDRFADWHEQLDTAQAAWVAAQGFTGALGQVIVFPTAKGGVAGAAAGLGTAADRARGRFALAGAAARLPAAAFHLDLRFSDIEPATQSLGWLLSGYRFTRYRQQPGPKARLIAPEGVNAPRLEAIAAGEALTRDLINTPASDMGPSALRNAVVALAEQFGASFSETVGQALLAQNFPMIHAVGRAAADPPRLLELRWGRRGPLLCLVGKGVCFDTGGLNLKPGGSMGLMKKDMGGAATVLGLARMIMALQLPLRLKVLIPAVENSVSGDSFRPQDILTSRKGLTVEINNTDAEGRLVLADALSYGEESAPDCLISMATLTGAARVALGPDIAPFFSGDDGLATALERAGARVADPVWRLPLWDPYEPMIEPGIADLDNAPKGGFAGAITAALFLRRFVERPETYTHFDIYGWQPAAAPGRPKGGVGQGARALLEALPEVLDL